MRGGRRSPHIPFEYLVLKVLLQGQLCHAFPDPPAQIPFKKDRPVQQPYREDVVPSIVRLQYQGNVEIQYRIIFTIGDDVVLDVLFQVP
nr:hypothetical protein [Anaerolineae bacterium]